MLLNSQQINSANDKLVVKVPTPEWAEGSHVNVRSITVEEHRNYIELCESLKKSAADKIMLLIIGCCDDDGKPLFTVNDAEWLVTKATAPVNRISDKFLTINGFAGNPPDPEPSTA